MRVPITPTFSPAFGVVSVSNFGHSNRCIVLSYCCFNLHFVKTYDGEHLFICSFSIYVSSLVRCVFRSFAHFSIKLFVFFLVSFKSSLYILDNSPLSDGVFGKYFLPVCGLCSNSLDVVFLQSRSFKF